MGARLTDLGEEFAMKNNLSGASVTIGLYNDGTDAITDHDDLAAITTEPSGAAYARQSDTLALAQYQSWAIVAVDTGTNVVEVSGDQTAELESGEEIEIVNSTGNDGYYTIASLNYDSGNDQTEITTNESISDSTADGDVRDNDWNASNGSQASYDTSDSSQNVDSYFLVANFQATTTGDGSATDHLIATGALSQSRDLSQIDTLNIAAGSAGFSLS